MEQKTPQRILYVVTKGNFGGAQRYVFELACAAKEAGHEVAVACGEVGLLGTYLSEYEIPVIPIATFQRDINTRKEYGALFSLIQLFRNYQPDIVHLNSSKAGVLGSIAARIARVPRIVFTAHGWPFLEQRSFLWRSMAWIGSYLTALLSHTVIVVSEHDLSNTNMSGVTHKLACIHTAVADFSLLSQEDARAVLYSTPQQRAHESDIWMVSIAELTPNKNLEHAIRALAQYNAAHSQKIFYTIIGTGELAENLQTLIRTLDCGYYVKLSGYLKDARNLLQAFNIFLLPSYKEGLPYTLLEAGAAGLGVVASNVGGIPEVITHEKSGLLCDPHDVEDITQKIAMLTDPTLRVEYTQTLTKHIASRFSLAHMLKETFAHYAIPPK